MHHQINPARPLVADVGAAPWGYVLVVVLVVTCLVVVAVINRNEKRTGDYMPPDRTRYIVAPTYDAAAAYAEERDIDDWVFVDNAEIIEAFNPPAHKIAYAPGWMGRDDWAEISTAIKNVEG